MKVLPSLSRREALALSALPAVGILGWGLRKLAECWTEDALSDLLFIPSEVPLPDAPDLHRLRRLADELAPLFPRLPAPQPDEWLAKHIEFGQTFAQFVVDRPGKLSDRYRRIGLVPLGELSEMQRHLFADTADFLERFFGFPVEPLGPVPLADLPEQAQRVRDSGDRQVLTSHLMNEILLPLREIGSNHLTESDRRPLEFCPECLPKIWWTCEVDPAIRFSRLVEFASEHRLDADAKLWRMALARLAEFEKTEA